LNFRPLLRIGALLLAAAVIATTFAACGRSDEGAHTPAAVSNSAPAGMAWDNQGDDWAARKAELQALGEQFESSQALFAKLQADAGGGKPLTWAQMGEPLYDWSGMYSRTKGPMHFDTDLQGATDPETAQLTPSGAEAVRKKREQIAKTGGEYDPISDCRPPGTPRWFTVHFLREWIVTPQQTWLINEMVNDVRRVYTDGRAHTADDDAYATWNGDTIGFWDGGTLTTHTKHLLPGPYQRGIVPDYSGQVTLVERWRKVDDKTVQADVWVYDPINLAKPWYTRQSYTKLANDDQKLRLRYWDCRENSNNTVIKRDDGASQFPDFNFLENDAAVSSDEAVKKAAAGLRK
jgi:hypothetical protein